MRRVLHVVSLVVGMITTGVGVVRLLDDSSAQPVVATATSTSTSTTPTTQLTPTTAPTQRCVNGSAGYSLDVPAGWTASDAECRSFNDGAITVETVNVRYEDWVVTYQDPQIEILRSEALRIDGRRAQFFEFHFKSGPPRSLEHVYLIDQGRAGLLGLTASSTDSPDFAETGEVLGAMARSVTFP